MTESPPVLNPFALMMDPDGVLRAVEQSQRLLNLRRRICRPLDKPIRGQSGEDNSEYDRTVEDAPETRDDAR